MSKMHWGDTRVVGVPISQPQFATQFMQDTGLRMAMTTRLRQAEGSRSGTGRTRRRSDRERATEGGADQVRRRGAGGDSPEARRIDAVAG